METINNREYGGIILGVAIRGSINNDRIFRVRHGNGYYNSILGAIYQDQFAYFVPSSINNPESAGRRRQWIAAVHKWRYDLTATQKEDYNKRAHKDLRMSGYNLFMREAMKGLVQMFIDRGDPATHDFRETDLTLDNAFHDLDLSSIVPAGAKAILLRVGLKDAVAGLVMVFRTKGNTNAYNESRLRTQVANVAINQDNQVIPDADRIIQYRISAGMDTVTIVVGGWWT